MHNEKIIEISNLSKQFREVKAVNNLSLNVHQGDVFGFLGPNGAGKSTTIRMLLSLISPSSGSIRIFGKNLKENRIEILRKIGAIVEKPDFYLYISAYKNLELLGKISGTEVNRKKIMDILELVGLASRAKSKVKTFSHGMKQRLGIAQALLHDPELIILDEPTTGLDPQGMKEIRELINYLSKEKKKTILLSSHILYEVELVANRMIIINKGSTIVEGLVSDLLNSEQMKLTLEVDDINSALKVLQESQWNEFITATVNNSIIFKMQSDQITEINRYMVEKSIGVKALIPTRSLEDYFLQLTEKGRE